MISVNKAILRGHLTVTLPVILILFGIPFLFIQLAFRNIITSFQESVFIISSFLVAWFYWSYSIVKWKLWAFKNVIEIDELKIIAIRQGLIWKDGSIFEKTEIKTKLEKQRLIKYEDDFYNKTEIETADKIEAYFSKTKLTFNIILVFPFFLLGIFLIFISKDAYSTKLIGVFCCIFFGIFGFLEIKNLFNSKPQIIISENGIQLNDGYLYSWSDIKDEEIISETNKTTLYFLTFNHSSGSKKILLNDLTTNEIEVESLLEKYKFRN